MPVSSNGCGDDGWDAWLNVQSQIQVAQEPCLSSAQAGFGLLPDLDLRLTNLEAQLR